MIEDIQLCADEMKSLAGIPARVNVDCYYDDTMENGITGKAFMVDEEEFMILVAPNRHPNHILETVAHELVHVRQFFEGSISYPLDTSIPYRNRPWEIEAYDLQSKIATQYIMKKNEENDK